jgi:hypothetical protein
MIDAFEKASNRVVGRDSLAGLQAVLDMLPNVEPFAFTGYPDNCRRAMRACGR